MVSTEKGLKVSWGVRGEVVEMLLRDCYIWVGFWFVVYIVKIRGIN